MNKETDIVELWRVEAGRDMRSRHTLRELGNEMADEIERLRGVLQGLTDLYVRLVNSGDAGNWNPEEEPEVIAARQALKGDSHD